MDVGGLLLESQMLLMEELEFPLLFFQTCQLRDLLSCNCSMKAFQLLFFVDRIVFLIARRRSRASLTASGEGWRWRYR